MYSRLKRIHDFAVFNANVIEYFAFFDDDYETKWLTSATCNYCAKQAAVYTYMHVVHLFLIGHMGSNLILIECNYIFDLKI